MTPQSANGTDCTPTSTFERTPDSREHGSPNEVDYAQRFEAYVRKNERMETKALPPSSSVVPKLCLYFLGVLTEVKVRPTGLLLVNTDLRRVYPWKAVQGEMTVNDRNLLRCIVLFGMHHRDVASAILGNIDDRSDLRMRKFTQAIGHEAVYDKVAKVSRMLHKRHASILREETTRATIRRWKR